MPLLGPHFDLFQTARGSRRNSYTTQSTSTPLRTEAASCDSENKLTTASTPAIQFIDSSSPNNLFLPPPAPHVYNPLYNPFASPPSSSSLPTTDVLTVGGSFSKKAPPATSSWQVEALFDSQSADSVEQLLPFDLPSLFLPTPFLREQPHMNLSSLYSHDSFATGSGAAAFDRGLASPLGLDESPDNFSTMDYSPMFENAAEFSGGEESDGDPPGFEGTIGDYDIRTSDLRFHPLFPKSDTADQIVPQASTSTSRTPSIPPTPTASGLAGTSSKPSRRTRSTTSTSTSLNIPPKPPITGFRGPHTPLLSLDAPIQPRSYIAPSATSRKRRRSSSAASPAMEDDGEGELSDSTLNALEKKRKQNTISARKSRARKQARLDELEDENEKLKLEVEEMREKIEGLEEKVRFYESRGAT